LANGTGATAAPGAATFDGATGIDYEFNINVKTTGLSVGDYILISSEEW
jgi:hypothetical protein